MLMIGLHSFLLLLVLLSSITVDSLAGLDVSQDGTVSIILSRW